MHQIREENTSWEPENLLMNFIIIHQIRVENTRARKWSFKQIKLKYHDP
jgi:hypothetical protein